MPRRLAAIAALVTFAVCVYFGGIAGDSPLAETLERGLLGMAVAGGVGALVGWMAQTMLAESIAAEERAVRERLRAEAAESAQAARDGAGHEGNASTNAQVTGPENPNRPGAAAGLSR